MAIEQNGVMWKTSFASFLTFGIVDDYERKDNDDQDDDDNVTNHDNKCEGKSVYPVYKCDK